MTFTSLTFILFFALVFSIYWSLKSRRKQNLLLLIASYTFYGWWDWRFCGLILFSSLVDFIAAQAIEATSKKAWRKTWLLGAIAVNLLLLGYFKYANFFMESFFELFGSLGLSDSGLLKVVLPVGISFYTFQTISYTVDVYRGRLQATKSLPDYLVYVSFFPQLVAGPIERGNHLLPQFLKPRNFAPEVAVDGMRQILWGCVQKMIIADNLGKQFVSPVYADLGASTGPAVIVATVCFAFQIYCDFAAYSNIAIGTAKMLGFNLKKNFAYPYFSQSVDEFWRRWHISLSTWFRDYLYIPLGGNRCSAPRYAFNVLLTFAISGLWHGAAWTFVIWGLLNGLGVLPGMLKKDKTQLKEASGATPGGNRLVPNPGILLRIGGTFFFICFTWVFFRANNLSEALSGVIAVPRDLLQIELWKETYWFLHGDNGFLTLSMLAVFILVEWCARRFDHPLQGLAQWPASIRWTIYFALWTLALRFFPMRPSDFIYFQF